MGDERAGITTSSEASLASRPLSLIRRPNVSHSPTGRVLLEVCAGALVWCRKRKRRGVQARLSLSAVMNYSCSLNTSLSHKRAEPLTGLRRVERVSNLELTRGARGKSSVPRTCAGSSPSLPLPFQPSRLSFSANVSVSQSCALQPLLLLPLPTPTTTPRPLLQHQQQRQRPGAPSAGRPTLSTSTCQAMRSRRTRISTMNPSLDPSEPAPATPATLHRRPEAQRTAAPPRAPQREGEGAPRLKDQSAPTTRSSASKLA
ncbi:hypothetical protein BCR35DRAFT_117323 [Leucosporidium creatinivorum]|uniref:Uncharacterized protein n=1 Tax=Leucosporidium creatinivorum TaxID=106004 RepID=A0A1Y2EZ06_9BASI|nr:hypothetical protein BCR35DRAFT_117323 [Leucosporidium creatinivorum]